MISKSGEWEIKGRRENREKRLEMQVDYLHTVKGSFDSQKMSPKGLGNVSFLVKNREKSKIGGVFRDGARIVQKGSKKIYPEIKSWWGRRRAWC